MSKRKAVVKSASGLHARPAHVFVEAANAESVPVTIAAGDGTPVDARSILLVMSLGATQGTEVTLEAEGPGAAEALERLVTVVETDHDITE